MTSTPRPLRRDAERNRQRILAAAREVFADRGLGASLDDVASHAGLGIGTVYRRFPAKENLVEALFENRLGEIVAAGHRALGEPDAWRGLTGFLETINAMHAADRGLREVTLGSRYGQERLARLRESLQPLVAGLVTRAQEQGTLRADIAPTDLPLIAIMISAVADYTAHVEPEIWRRCLSVVIDGLRAAPASTPLRPAPLTLDQIDDTMRSWRPHHRT